MIFKKWFSWTPAELALSGLLVIGASATAFSVARPDLSAQEKAVRPYDVSRIYSGKGWCTTFQPEPGVIISADHCHYIVSSKHEVVVRAPGVFDGAIYGEKLNAQPRAMIEGEKVWLVGYPARSFTPIFVPGYVHFKRSEAGQADYSNPATIIRIENGAEPVINGMSGGGVFSEDFKPLGIINTQNGRADLDNDGVPDDSADVTELHDLYVIQ